MEIGFIWSSAVPGVHGIVFLIEPRCSHYVWRAHPMSQAIGNVMYWHILCSVPDSVPAAFDIMVVSLMKEFVRLLWRVVYENWIKWTLNGRGVLLLFRLSWFHVLSLKPLDASRRIWLFRIRHWNLFVRHVEFLPTKYNLWFRRRQSLTFLKRTTFGAKIFLN